MSEDKFERKMHEMRQVAAAYAQVKGELAYLEQFRKSKKAILMKDAEAQGYASAAMQEREAYAHTEYVQLLEALKIVTADAEDLRWKLVMFQTEFDRWRTIQANRRQERVNHGA